MCGVGWKRGGSKKHGVGKRRFELSEWRNFAVFANNAFLRKAGNSVEGNGFRGWNCMNMCVNGRICVCLCGILLVLLANNACSVRAECLCGSSGLLVRLGSNACCLRKHGFVWPKTSFPEAFRGAFFLLCLSVFRYRSVLLTDRLRGFRFSAGPWRRAGKTDSEEVENAKCQNVTSSGASGRRMENGCCCRIAFSVLHLHLQKSIRYECKSERLSSGSSGGSLLRHESAVCLALV